MINLIQHEIKKILNRKSVILTIFVLLLACGLILINSIIQNKQYDDRSGIESIVYAKEKKKELTGKVSQQELQNCIKIYLNIINDKKNYDTNGNIRIANEDDKDDFIKYGDLADLLTRVYSPLGTYDANIFNKIDERSINSKDIFSNRKKSIDRILNMNHLDLFSDSKLFEYNYTTGWQSLFNDLGIIQLIILIFVAILISPIFSIEYKYKVAPVLYSSKLGKTRIVTAKLLSSIIIVTVIYFIPILCYSIVKLSIFGFDGFNSYIQTTSAYWLSLYPMSFLCAYVVILFSGYIATLSTMSICLLISKISKKESLSIILNLLIILLPVILTNNLVLKPVLNFMPSNIIGDTKLLLNFDLIHLHIISFSKLIMVESTLIIVIFIILIYIKRSFKKITI